MEMMHVFCVFQAIAFYEFWAHHHNRDLISIIIYGSYAGNYHVFWLQCDAQKNIDKYSFKLRAGQYSNESNERTSEQLTQLLDDCVSKIRFTAGKPIMFDNNKFARVDPYACNSQAVVNKCNNKS